MRLVYRGREPGGPILGFLDGDLITSVRERIDAVSCPS
jgi:hypothetical protein